MFNYTVSCSAPILSPVRVLTAEFISESGTLHADFGHVFNCSGMGTGRNTVAGTRNNKYYLPKAIVAIWASYVDRKVYYISAALPYDEIFSIFKEYNGINQLDLCFLPEGKVILYAKGRGWKFVLDWFVYGIEDKDDKILEQFYLTHGCQNINEYFDDLYSLEEENKSIWYSYFKENGSPSTIINKYLKRYNYELNFEFEDEDATIIHVWSPFVNQERYPGTADYKGLIKLPTIVKEITLKWNVKSNHFNAYMYFNEEEILQAFNDVYGDDLSQKGILTIKISKYNNLFHILLNVGDKSFVLNKTEIDVFKFPIEDIGGDGELIYDNYKTRNNYFRDDYDLYHRDGK